MHNNLKEVVLLFLKLGFIAFGGPAAHIAMMEDEVVTKRNWMSRQKFLDLMGATNLIPGPNSTEMTMHCGYERAGIKGLFAAGLAFILPAVLITGIFAYLYVAYGSLPEVEPFIRGIKPAVLVIIFAAVLKLGKKAVKGWELGLLGILVVAASLIGMNEIIALLGAGVLGMLYFLYKNNYPKKAAIFAPFLFFQLLAHTSNIASTKIFISFLKVGAVLYGSGYVLFAYLDTELVKHGLLTRLELMDAIAVGQFTPGPVLSTATFIGFQLNGISGALAATLGIFLPSFLFVLIFNPLIDRMRSSKILGYFLDAVNVAAVAVMIAVLYKMTLEIMTDWRSPVITLLTIILHYGFKKSNSVITVIGGGILGYALYSFL